MSDQLLSKSEQAGIYYLAAARRTMIENAARQLQFRHWHLEIPPRQMAGAVLEQIGKVLHFPEWYGANFDALHDCLTDPDWASGKGIALFLTGTASLHKCDPDGLATLIEVFQAVADELGRSGTPFWVLLDSPATDIPTLPEA